MATANNSKVVFMPVETSAMLSSIGSIKEVFGEKLPAPVEDRRR